MIFQKIKIIMKVIKKDWLLAVFSGVILGLSYPPFPFPFLSFTALVPFFIVIEKRESISSINRISYIMFFSFTIVTLYWVGSWTAEADPFLMISGVALMFVNPFLYLIITTMYGLARKVFGKKYSIYFIPLFWSAFEFLYGLTDLRFPWLILGNSQAFFIQFIQIAEIIGATGLTIVIVFINILLYHAYRSYREGKLKYSFLIAAIIIFSSIFIYGVIRIEGFEANSDTVKVGIVQPNINPWDKWSEGNLNDQLDIYLEQSTEAVEKGARLIFWPESALPVYLLSGNYDPELSRIYSFVQTNNVHLITGMPDINFFYNEETKPADAKKTQSGISYTSYNSIYYFSPSTNDIQKYRKNLLVPFGEHVPFVEQLPFLGDWIKWQVGISSWNKGKEQNVIEMMENNSPVNVGTVICIESIYPDYVAKFIQSGANFIAVVTNDSWYGYSSGPFQHKEIGVLRAVENRRNVIRCANGGISCIIDATGKTKVQSQLFTKTTLVDFVELRNDVTFYSQYPLVIPYLSLISVLLMLVLFLINKLFPNVLARFINHEKNN
ncbi:MAG: apolipoprotein N-acyltransferase [Melioribacteraceae bacterium]|nr:apolipoprotein N-acyltransferase [Melioribacteraceae bacterium]